MDRLEHLSVTLPTNLDVLSRVPDAEIIILDYNSAEPLERWLSSALIEPRLTDRLAVFRTDEPILYDSSHSKNVAHKLARGDVLLNLDADQFLTDEYMSFVRSRFAGGRACVIYGKAKSAGGRVALRREHFHGVGGYDESFSGWGADDVDIVKRASTKYAVPAVGTEAALTPCISHDDALRTRRMQLKDIRRSNALNLRRSRCNVASGKLVSNAGKDWGRAIVRRIWPPERS